MARTARRSVASDHQSSPKTGHYTKEHRQHHSAGHFASNGFTQDATNTTHHHTSRRSNNAKNGAHFSQRNKNQTRAPSPTPYTLPEHYYIVNATAPPSLEHIAAERERIRMEFYATYDVMTGVRIAATLGGFFGLMVFLVIYKSRGETHETMKALKDPKIAAVAAAVMQEEEERELQEAMEATGMSIYPDEYVDRYLGFRRQRMMSLGNVSAPPVLNRGYRFSSIGGYSSLLGSSNRRLSYTGVRRKSTSVESSRIFSAYPMGGSFGIDDYFIESDGDEADDEFDQITNSADVEENANNYHLSVQPNGQTSRRCSNITCCSSESSYLERRCSAITLGLTPLPPISSRCPSTTDMWDYFAGATPAIQVIEATPKTSPCPSERSDRKVHENVHASTGQRRRRKPQKSLSEQDSFDLIAVYPDSHRTTQPHYYDEFEEDELAETAALAQQINKLSRDNRCLDDSIITSTVNNTLKTSLLLNRRAPLASLSSLKISSVDYQDSDLHSLGSDSVFGGGGGDGAITASARYADTDDDMEQFSTDSDAVSDNGHHFGTQRPLRPSKVAAQRSSIVCADIELKPRDLLASDTIEKPKTFGTKVPPIASEDCKLAQPLDAMAARITLAGSNLTTHGQENGSQPVLQPIVLTQKRSASFAGVGKDDGTSSCSSISQTNDNVNNNNDNNKTKQLHLSSGNNNTRCSKSTGDMADELLRQRPQQQQQQMQQPEQHARFSNFSSSILTPSSNQTAARTAHSSQQHSQSHQTHPHHTYFQIADENVRKMPNQSSVAAQIIRPADDTIESSSNCRQRQSSSIVNPSVILELPVIVSPHDSTVIETEPNTFDPSLPGPSRKWSKETLF